MTGVLVYGVMALLIIGGFLWLLSMFTRVDQPGEKTVTYYARFLFLMAVLAAIFLAAIGIKEGWKP